MKSTTLIWICVFLLVLDNKIEKLTGIGEQTLYYEGCYELVNNECIIYDRREITFKTDFNNQKVYTNNLPAYIYRMYPVDLQNLPCNVYDSTNWSCMSPPSQQELTSIAMHGGSLSYVSTFRTRAYKDLEDLDEYNSKHSRTYQKNLFTFFTIGIPIFFGITE